MNNVAIVGTGLIGASFGLALRQAGFGGAIVGVSSGPAIADAVAAGAIDRGAPLAEAVGQAVPAARRHRARVTLRPRLSLRPLPRLRRKHQPAARS